MTNTDILDLARPNQGDSNWHIPVNANFTALNDKLGKAYKYLWNINNVTYISTNAKYVTDHWERWDNSKSASIIKIDDGLIEQYACIAGTGTIEWSLADDVFGDGRDGAYSASSDDSLGGIKFYTTFNDNGHNISITENSIIYATESITISGNMTVAATGGAGGISFKDYTSIDLSTPGEIGYWGGNGGNGGATTVGIGGTIDQNYPEPDNMKYRNEKQSINDIFTIYNLTTKPAGAGGGGGRAVYTDTLYVGGNGGKGGGFIILCAPAINISGNIYAKGQDGYDTPNPGVVTGGGGAGGGGSIRLFYNILTETGILDVSGGLGGSGGTSGYNGENGSNGVIQRMQY